ncbi:hypothetical protein VIGAN_10172300, partial [Vigna angularis var. angularis]
SSSLKQTILFFSFYPLKFISSSFFKSILTSQQVEANTYIISFSFLTKSTSIEANTALLKHFPPTLFLYLYTLSCACINLNSWFILKKFLECCTAPYSGCLLSKGSRKFYESMRQKICHDK